MEFNGYSWEKTNKQKKPKKHNILCDTVYCILPLPFFMYLIDMISFLMVNL